MKRIIRATLVGSIILISFITSAYSLPWPPELDVIYIKFNYTSGYSYDALTIKKNNSTSIQIPEWNNGGATNEPFAYIKSQSSRKIEARFWVDRTSFQNIGILAVMSGQGIGGIGEHDVYFNGAQYVTKIMTCSGSVPSSVGIRNFSWSWYVTYIDYVEFDPPLWIGDTGDHEYYTLLAAPQAPMSVPWTDVLDYSCDWASGQSGSTGAAREITEGIYYNLGDQDGDIDYDSWSHYTFYTYWKFKLTSFLIDIKSSSSVKVNCSDVGNIFNIFSTAIGLSSMSKVIAGSFVTKLIDPIGSPGWNTTSWVYHQYGWFNDLVDDACLRVNYSSPILPTNMNQSTYDGYLIASGGYTNTYTGVSIIIE